MANWQGAGFWRIDPRESKIVNLIAYSFGIYLIRCFWLNISNKGLHIYPSAFPPIVGEVAIFTYALIASILSCLILYRLPAFKKILRWGLVLELILARN